MISDAHKGIQKAVELSFVGASWQYCHFHHSRAVLESIPNKDKQEIADKLKEASDDEMKMQELAKELRDRGYDPVAQRQSTGSDSIYGIIRRIRRPIGRGYEPQTSLSASIRN